MIKYVYIVHSDIDENNIYDEFEFADEAIEYAKDNEDYQTYVVQVEVEVNDFGEVVDEYGAERIWTYDAGMPDEALDDDTITDKDEAELDADFKDLAEHEYTEADMMDTLEDQAMAEAEHPVDEAMKVKDNKLVVGDEEMVDEEQALKAAEPVTDEKTIKAAIDDRVDSAEKKMETAIKDMDPEKEVDTVCKSTKVILHSEDDVKDLKEEKDYHIKLDELEAKLEAMDEETKAEDTKPTLKESLLQEGLSAEAVAIISELIEDEWEAISGYEDAVAKLEKLDIVNKEQVLHVLNHISEEESIHVGQLEQIVKLLNPEHIAKQDEGHEEGAEELAGENPHEEEVSVEEEPKFTLEEPEIVEVEESLNANDDYDIRNVRGHFEVYKNGKFILSADTESEAEKELDKLCASNEELKLDIDNTAELKKLLSVLSNDQLVDFNNKHWAETTTYENGKFNLYDHNAEKPYNTMSRPEFEDLIIRTIDSNEIKDLEQLVKTVNKDIDYNKLREELEENEDEVECQRCFDTFAKEDCIKEEHGYICKHCYAQEHLNEDINTMLEPEPGMTIKINRMEGEPDYTGRTGIIKFIDDLGQLHGTWGGLAVIPEEDDFEIISEDKLTESIDTLDFYKKVINKYARNKDFVRRAKQDIYYIDEVAPGLHSIVELSDNEIKELEAYLQTK